MLCHPGGVGRRRPAAAAIQPLLLLLSQDGSALIDDQRRQRGAIFYRRRLLHCPPFRVIYPRRVRAPLPPPRRLMTTGSGGTWRGKEKKTALGERGRDMHQTRTGASFVHGNLLKQ